MKNSSKNFLIESSLIIGLAIIVAIAYNTLNPNGINLFHRPPIVQDTLLEKLLSEPSRFENDLEEIQNTEQQTNRNDTRELNNSPKEIAKVQNNESTEIIPSSATDIELAEITYSQLVKYLKHPNLILIDARSPEDFARGHIGKAINIFAYNEDMNQYFSSLSSIPMDKSNVIIVYCDGGTCDASHKVATDLIRLGYKNVFVYSGGWEEWSNIQKKQQ